MNWSFLLTFVIGLVAYLAVLGIFALIKHIRNKKKFDREKKENQDE